MIGRDFPGDDPHECRLSRTIAAQQSDPLPRLDLARHIIQKWWPAKGNTDFVDLNYGCHVLCNSETRWASHSIQSFELAAT